MYSYQSMYTRDATTGEGRGDGGVGVIEGRGGGCEVAKVLHTVRSIKPYRNPVTNCT